jgi:hypothetical protein
MATLRGEPVDRPAVCFYELNAIDQKPDNPDPYNIFNHPSWKPLLDLTRDRTDRIVLRSVGLKNAPPDPVAPLRIVKKTRTADSVVTRVTLRAGPRTLATTTRRDRDVNTVWTTEHLLKDADDLRAWLDLPEQLFGGTVDTSSVLDTEKALGDAGICLIDTADPLCQVAALFDMGAYTVIAMTEPDLFHRALQRCARYLQARTEAVARALPGRHWRIYGPEYAGPPYLPPRLFREYVVTYDKPMIAAIHATGGFARIHSHGRLRDILPHILATGAMGLDPIEPPPQGDVELSYVRRNYGKELVLFGNLEVSDIENLPTPEFARKIRTALKEGTEGEGRGFVLMPSACPYGRVVTELTLANYRKMVQMTERIGQ